MKSMSTRTNLLPAIASALHLRGVWLGSIGLGALMGSPRRRAISPSLDWLSLALGQGELPIYGNNGVGVLALRRFQAAQSTLGDRGIRVAAKAVDFRRQSGRYRDIKAVPNTN
ncbi:MAG: hypothetical protein VKK04_23305 [Synechococcales bacterium]|nr:hypothetical protein [Synechococcales bacterium]